MQIRIAQCVVSKNIDLNKNKILNVISRSQEDEWIVFPEAILSGYYPAEKEYTNNLDWTKIENHLKDIEKCVVEKKCHCLIGTASKRKNKWFNSIYFFSYLSEPKRHDKKYLSSLDKKQFEAGRKIEIFTLGNVNFGMLACRELIFSQEWNYLKLNGAKIVFHLNNAIQPQDELWKHILISRAIENSIFVVSVNNGEVPQKLGSYIIKPNGKIIAETRVQCEETVLAEVDLGEVIIDLSKREDY